MLRPLLTRLFGRALGSGAGAHRQLVASTIYYQRSTPKSSGMFAWSLFSAAAISAGAVLGSSTLLAEGLTYKEKVIRNYEKRIRSHSTPEKLFAMFASVEKDGEWFMTPEDFVNSITPFDTRSHPPLKRPEYSIFSGDSNDLMSFAEFIFNTILLGLPQSEFRVAFHMMDSNGNGELDSNEFLQVFEVMLSRSKHGKAVRSLNLDTAKRQWHILEYFFGEEGNRTLSFEQFQSYIDRLKGAVLRMEFDFHMLSEGVPIEQDSISAQTLAKALVMYAPVKLLENYEKRLGRLADRKERVSFDDFLELNRIFSEMKEILNAMEAYSLDDSYDPGLLQRATKAVTGQELPPLVIDIIFALFDENEDGKLSARELSEVVESRSGMGLQSTSGATVVGCIMKCMTS